MLTACLVYWASAALAFGGICVYAKYDGERRLRNGEKESKSDCSPEYEAALREYRYNELSDLQNWMPQASGGLVCAPGLNDKIIKRFRRRLTSAEAAQTSVEEADHVGKEFL